MTIICWNCGGSLADIPRPISRHATCSHCFNELHCCRLCRHYDPKRTMQCFEDRADPPLQKENANFCDFFVPGADAFQARTTTKADTAKSQLDALFGETDGETSGENKGENNEENNGEVNREDSGPVSEEDATRRKLDDLFN